MHLLSDAELTFVLTSGGHNADAARAEAKSVIAQAAATSENAPPATIQVDAGLNTQKEA